jgi:hypothetical protein
MTGFSPPMPLASRAVVDAQPWALGPLAGEPGRRMTQKANRSITGDPVAITMEPVLLVDVEMV